MALKTILACLTDPSSADSVMAAACALARRHDAHLITVHTVEALMVYPGIAMHLPATVYETYGDAQVELSATLKAIFEKHTHAEDFVSEWRLLQSEANTGADRIIECARSVDMVLMAAAQSEEDTAAHLKLVENVIRDSGRPVLVVPTGFDGDALGLSVLVGWNETRESTRAAHDALTLLQEGDTVHILCVKDSGFEAKRDTVSSDLAAAFARHGIETTLTHKTWTHDGIAAALNKEAFEKGADMIAIGAYGHSRAYDLVIGSATRDLLKQSDLPVLFCR